ncbi:MAG TPA: zinc ribbon domain-containing protein [Chloroflexia bacterium]|nr:zinc ribbon domain-containing protein [Chloroflexia bacterium]
MATLIVCPRCKGSLAPEAKSCPRCGLVLPGASAASKPPPRPASGTPVQPAATAVSFPMPPPTRPAPAEYNPNGNALSPTRTYQPEDMAASTREQPRVSGPLSSRVEGHGGNTGPLNYAGRQTGPLNYSGPLLATGPLVPKGALQLLQQESVAYQLGALYLTNKRVILLAPSVVRSAFVRDIDAVGTLAERASGWNFFFGLLLLSLAGALLYAQAQRDALFTTFSLLYIIPPFIPGLLLGLLGLFLMARYFLWRKRSLFVSVKGRPLITVSMADWKPGKLAGMDSFVNAFFEIKDSLTGELGERQIE